MKKIAKDSIFVKNQIHRRLIVKRTSECEKMAAIVSDPAFIMALMSLNMNEESAKYLCQTQSMKDAYSFEQFQTKDDILEMCYRVSLQVQHDLDERWNLSDDSYDTCVILKSEHAELLTG